MTTTCRVPSIKEILNTKQQQNNYCLFELMLDSNGHVWMLPPFLWDFYPTLGCHDTQNVLYKYNHPSKPIRLIRAARRENRSSGVPTSSNIKRPVQSQKQARSLKFRI